MKKLYIFSGLGADRRVFKYLDFSGFDVTFIEWIAPKNNEAIEEYAKRLTQQIHSEKPILIGLSFGGIMATEVAKQIQTEKIILIASAKTKNEVPFYYRFMGVLQLHKLVPAQLMKQANFFSFWLFGIKKEEDKKLLKSILLDTDSKFLKWAIHAIVSWKNMIAPQNCFHIHGSSDKILPLQFVKADSIVEGGGHFMTINKPEELSLIIRQYFLNS